MISHTPILCKVEFRIFPWKFQPVICPDNQNPE